MGKEEELSRLSDLLLLNGTLTKCPGLLHGKMGISIFFFHYGRYLQEDLYSEYAMDLIGVLLGQLHANYRADYEKGIAGIGVGFTYLLENNFLDLEEEAFDDFDERMYRAVWYDPYPDFSRYEGMCGYGEYWIARLRRNPSSIRALDCLSRILEQIERVSMEHCSCEWQDVYGFIQALRIFPAINIPPGLLGLSASMMSYDPEERNLDLSQAKEAVPMGLLSGYAGKGMTLLTEMGVINSSWKTFI